MTDHPDLAAIRASVLAAPADDVPRLALADRLEELDGAAECQTCKGAGSLPEQERGTDGLWRRVPTVCQHCSGSGRVPNGYAERAEFIRLQCEIARLDGGDRCPACDWPYRPGEGCEPGNCSFRPGRHNPEYARWKERQTAYHALREREHELCWTYREAWLFPVFGSRAWGVGHGATLTNTGRHDGLEVTFRRGFVAHVRCPLAVWLGNRCAAVGPHHGDGCDGGRVQSPNAQFTQDCTTCRGTGYVGGVAAAVCGSQPVERVTLSDRKADGSGPTCDWWEIGDLEFPQDIPTVLFALMWETHPDWQASGTFHSRLMECPTRQAALDALSAAALAVGRERAKLGKPRASETRELHQ